MTRLRSGAAVLAAWSALALAACQGAEPAAPPAPGLLVTGGPLAVSEGGATAAFQIALATAPQADVEVDVLAEDATEGVLLGPGGAPGAWLRLRFSPASWDAPQAVTVRGVDDDVRDGDREWRVLVVVSASADPGYASLPREVVEVVTRDDDTPGVRLGRTSLFTEEAGAVTDAFTVTLESRPSAVVTVAVESGDPSEGLVAAGPHTIAPASAVDLVFTPSNWSTPQAVTVWAVPDLQVDGAQVYGVSVAAASDDPEYAALPAQQVTVVNADADVAGVVATWDGAASVQEGAGGWCAWQSGTCTRLAVTLATIPAAPVEVAVSSSDPGEAAIAIVDSGPTGASVTLTFTADAWNVPQYVFVWGTADYEVDGDQPVQLTIGPAGGDAVYAAVPARTLDVTVRDQDRPAEVVVWFPAEPQREGAVAPFRLRLSTVPSEPVWVRVTPGDPGQVRLIPWYADAMDGASGLFFFDAQGWSADRVGFVEVVHDGVVRGTRTVPMTVETSTGDPRFAALPARTIDVVVRDLDTAGIALSSYALGILESDSAFVGVALTAAPAADVIVPLASSDPAEALLSLDGAPGASLELTFTPSSWSQYQWVRVSAVNDAVLEPDPPHPYTITVGPTRSASVPYDGVPGSVLDGMVLDDEQFPTEGSLDAPIELTGVGPWAGQVGPWMMDPPLTSTSYYRLSGFPEGGLVRVKGAFEGVSLSVLEDAPEHATLCAPRSGVDVSCAVRLPPGGSFVVAVDGRARRGTAFTLDAAPFTFATDLPAAIPPGGAPGASSRIALSGVPPDYAGVALFVEIAHPSASDLQLWLTPPPGGASYQFAWCASAGADYDRTVVCDDPSLPYLCTGTPPYAGTFRPSGMFALPHPDAAVVNGTWTLEARDVMGAEVGTFVRWGIVAR